jgi:hypothetical protein
VAAKLAKTFKIWRQHVTNSHLFLKKSGPTFIFRLQQLVMMPIAFIAERMASLYNRPHSLWQMPTLPKLI